MFDIQQSIYDRHGELDDERVAQYIDGLCEAFAASPEGQPICQAGGGGWAAMMMEYAINYPGTTPAQMSPGDFNEVVFQLFPRKVSTEPESAPEIIAELKAFWTFLDRQYGLGNARQILATLDDKAVHRLRKELADPSNYGMAKSFFMLGSRAGFDMTTQEGLNQFQQVYNSGPAAGFPGVLDDVAGDNRDPLSWLLGLPGEPRKSREEKRKERKRQRQARKRNRR
jgi:hypothetical protein